MAATFGNVASGGGFPPGSPSFVLGMDAGTDRSLLLAVFNVGSAGAPVFSNVLYDGVPGTQIGTNFGTIFGRRGQTTLFQWLDASLPALTGGYNLTYTASGPYDSRAVGIWYSGVEQVLATPTVVSLAGQNNPPLSGIQNLAPTGLAPSGVILDFFGAEPSGGPLTSTPGAGQVARATASDIDTLISCSSKVYSGGGIQSVSQTPSGTYFTFAYLAAVLREAASTTSKTSFPLGTQG